MFCPKCGKINPDNEEKCSGCGALLREETAVAVPTKKGKGLKIAVAVIAIVVIVCILVFLLNGCGTAALPEDRIAL